jgi:cyanate permease
MIWGMSPLGIMVAVVAAGSISDHIGSRWGTAIGIFICAFIGALRALPESHVWLAALMFFYGVGMAFIIPNLPRLVGLWFPQERLGLATGTVTIGLAAGGALSMALSASVLAPAVGGWRNLMWALGIVVFFLGLLWVAVVREPGGSKDAPTHGSESMREAFAAVMRVRDVWFLAAMYLFFITGYISFIGHFPDVLVGKGISEAKAGLLTSIILWTVIPMNILGPHICDRLGLRKPFILPLAIMTGLVITSLGSVLGAPLIILMIVFAVAFGSFGPLIFVLPMEVEGVGPSRSGMALGLMLMAGNLGGFVGPIAVGKLLEIGIMPAFLMLGACYILVAVFYLPIKETGPKRKRVIEADNVSPDSKE